MEGIAASLQLESDLWLLDGSVEEASRSAQEALLIFTDLKDSPGMARSLLIAAQATVNSDARKAVQQAQKAAAIFQQLGEDLCSEEANEVVREAQEKLREQRSQLSSGSGKASASRLPVDADRSRIPSSSPATPGYTPGLRNVGMSSPGGREVATVGMPSPVSRQNKPTVNTAPNGTRRGGLGFNSFGRNPFELH